MGEAACIRLRLLGRFAASVEGDAPRSLDISGKLRRALLAYLAMQPDFAETRERLAALLWGDSSDAKARQSLRQCLLDLRHDFEGSGCDPLKVDRETVALDPAAVTVDAREFVALSRSDDLAELERAGDLYGGPFADGLDMEHDGFRAWLDGERSRIEQATAALFEKLALLQDGARNGAKAVRMAERLVALDPLRESAQRLLIGLLARYSGRDAALAQASALVALLRSELDVEPDPETAALIEEVRRAPGASVAPRAARPGVAGAGPTQVASEPRAASSRGRLVFATIAGAAGLCVAGLLFAHNAGWFGVQATPSLPQGVIAAARESDPWAPPQLLPGVSAESRQLAAQGVTAIVVLPFTAEGAERSPEQVAADNITTDLTNDLSRVPGLRVISRATSRVYRGRTVDVAAVGAELGVRYVVEGDVRLNDGHLRVNIALTDTRSRLQVWSERFERDGASGPEVQNEIVRGLARQLHFNFLTVEEARRTPDQSHDPTIADLLAKGWGAVLRGAREGMTGSGADSYFEQVLQRDPNNVSALTGIGAFYGSAAADYLYPDPQPYLDKAEKALRQAIALRPQNSLSYYFLGVVHKARGQPQEALAAFARTLELNPSFAPAYANSGHVLYRNGHLEQAVENVRYAMRLSPKDTNIGRWSLYLGQIEVARGNYKTGEELLRRSIEAGGGGPAGHASLAAAYALQGDAENAAKHVAEARKAAPWLTADMIIQRAIAGSQPGHEPTRLIEGLRKAFGNAS